MKKRILVCGATGFIGRNMTEYFSQKSDYEVHAVRFARPEYSCRNVIWHQADLRRPEEVQQLVPGFDIIIQAAATTSGAKDIVSQPYIHVTDNAVMNSIILRACFERKVKHVVFFSCSIMYLDQELPVKEEDFNYRIIDKYFGIGWTKVYIEKMCEFYSRISDTKYAVVRHSNVYGPHDKYDLERSHVFGATISKVMKAGDGKVAVWGNGSEERDLLYVSDLVDFVETILESQEAPFELINVGYGSSISIKHLIEKIIEISGRRVAVEFDPTKPTINFRLTLDIDKARKKYKWEPKISLEDGIRESLKWYNENILRS